MDTNIYNSLDIPSVIDFLKEELMSEKAAMLAGKDNHYSYLFMLLNDIGITV